MSEKLFLKYIGYAKKISALVSELLFEPFGEKRIRFGAWLWLAILYAIGVYFWGAFFSWGKIDLNFHDWAVINIPRFDVIHDAYYYHMFPLHAACGECLHGITDRFWVLPDVVTTPQMILLLLVTPSVFVLIDVLFHFSLATIGLLLLRKRFKLSLISYTFLFVLFQFNGYIQSHYAVGHATWAGYFLFPLFFEFIFQLLDEGPNWQWVTKISILSFYTILIGSQHHFTWMMLFLSFLALSYRPVSKWILVAIFCSGFASAFRLIPPVLGIDQFTFKFFGVPGYQTIYDFLISLAVYHGPTYQFEAWPLDIGYWEFDYYIGLIGTIFLIYFGVYHWVKDWNDKKTYSMLMFPTLALFLFSQGSLYKMTLLRLPVLASERIASRMVSLPVTLILIMAAIYINERLRSKDITARWLSIIALVFIGNDLYVHGTLWRIKSIVRNFSPQLINLSGNSIVNHSDPQYLAVLYFGAGLSLITLLVLLIFVVVEKRSLKRLK